MALDDVEERFRHFSLAFDFSKVFFFFFFFLGSSDGLAGACFSFQVAQFLVGLAERPSPNTHPKRYECYSIEVLSDV